MSVSGHSFKYPPYERVNPDIIKMLLNAGGNISTVALLWMIEGHDDECVIQIMRERMQQFHKEWNSSDCFRYAFKFLRVDTCKEIVQLMVDAGADLDYTSTFHDTKLPSKVIDIAAKRADLSLVQMLVDHTFTPTGDTLACAVSGGAVDVVKFFLKCGSCAVDDIGPLKITPLAAAIRRGDLQIRELLVEKGALISLTRKSRFSSALDAASVVGDIPFLEYLINLGGEVTPDDLGYALSTLVKDGHTNVASMLIDAGASLDICYRSTQKVRPALLEALLRRDLDLTNRLIDAGADPNYGDSDYQFSAIQLAVEWGHLVIINRLIFEGVDVNVSSSQNGCSALTIAVENGDYDMLRILLNAGASVNHHNTRRVGMSPMAAATRKGDMKMIQFLFDHGADPNDSQALQDAASSEVIDVLLARFRKIYPYGCSGFGGTLLKSAIMDGDETSVARMLENNMDPKTLLSEQGIFSREQSLESPFGFAIKKAQPNRNSIVKLILKKGCDPNGIVSRSS